MKRNRMRSRLFRRTMLTYIVILMIPIVTFCGMTYNQVQRESRSEVLKSYQESAANIAGILDRKFFDVAGLGDRMLTTNWIQRVRSDSPIINRYFDQTRMQDISQELLIHAATLGIASDITVLLPQKGEAVSSYGWGTLEEMLGISGVTSESGRETLLELAECPGHFTAVNAGGAGIIENSGDLYFLQNLDMLTPSRAVLLILVKEDSLDTFLEKLHFGSLCALSIRADEAPFYQYTRSGGDGGGAYAVTVPSGYFNWEYEIKLEEIPPASFLEKFSMAFLALAVSCSLGGLAAYALAAVSYKPIQSLISRIGGDRRGPEFQAISDSFDQLTAEKEELNNMVKQFQATARNNLLANLLQGYFTDDKITDQLRAFHLLYDNSQFYTVLVFRGAEVQEDQRFQLILNIKAGLLAEKLTFELLEIPDGTIAAILNFGGAEQAAVLKGLKARLPRHIREKMNLKLQISCGTVEQGLIGISKSYQAAKEKNASLSFAQSGLPAGRYYYPTDWELQFVNNLKLGNGETAAKILGELELENDRRELPPAQQLKLVSMIFDTILRVMEELDIDSAETAGVFEERLGPASKEKQWAYLRKLTGQICGRVSYASRRQPNHTGEHILRYVDAHYADPALSLKELGDQLGLSVSAVSRIFKATVKINFYDYLCRVRMEKAKEALRSTALSVAEVARRVGYENVLSFKRAFLRYEGISPREFRQQAKTAGSLVPGAERTEEEQEE